MDKTRTTNDIDNRNSVFRFGMKMMRAIDT